MHARRIRRWTGLLLTTTALAAVSGAPAGADTVPSAQPFGGVGAVGALFSRGPHGGLGKHFCSAAVVNSPSGDMVITAAHCLDGRVPSRVAFVPGYNAGREPYGVWLVRQVIRDGKWVSHSAPDHDIAFLLVRRPGSTETLQSLTGGDGIGSPADGQRVLTIGYPDGIARPVGCVNVIRDVATAPVEFDCSGYAIGTSGGPLIAAFSQVTGLGVIIGVIGGYEQGGYSNEVSYSARFGQQVAALYDKAVRADETLTTAQRTTTSRTTAALSRRHKRHGHRGR
jgi:hypothetical protein